METIVFLGVNKFGSSRDAIKVAKAMGFYTILLTNHPKHIEQREEYPDVDQMIKCDLSDFDRLCQLIREFQKEGYQIQAIISFIDPWVGQASKLAEKFHLSPFSTRAIFKMLDKSKSRKMLDRTPFNPYYFTVTDLEEISLYTIKRMFPFVIKLANSNGSKDVYLCQTLEDFQTYSEQLKPKINEKNPLIIEEYIPGQQILVETLVIHGKVHLIAIVEQTIEYINGHFIVTGYSILHDYTRSFYRSLKEGISWILSEFGFSHGPCHFEFRRHKGIWKLIEVNPRISGSGMNTFVLEATGINIVQETLHLALNREVNLTPSKQKYIYAKYLTIGETGILEKVTGKHRALRCPGVLQVFIRPRKGHLLNPPTSMGHRYAIVMAEGRSPREARERAEEAIKHITFHVKPLSEEQQMETSIEASSQIEE